MLAARWTRERSSRWVALWGRGTLFLPRCGRCSGTSSGGSCKVAIFAEVFGVERLSLFVVEVEPVFAVSVAGQDMPLQREDLPVFVVVTQAAADFASAVVEVVKGQAGLQGGDGETAFVVGVERADRLAVFVLPSLRYQTILPSTAAVLKSAGLASFFRVNGAVCGVSLSW